VRFISRPTFDDTPLEVARCRAILGLAMGVAECALAGRPSPGAVIAALFALYAIVVWTRGGARNRGFALLSLFLDTVFLLLLVWLSADRSMWLASGFYVYLVGSAVAQFGPAEVALIWVTTVVLASAVIRADARLIQTFLACGGLVSAWAYFRARSEKEKQALRSLAGKAVEEARVAREQERQRIAADFHDGPLQSFISFQIRLDVLRKLLERNVNAGLDELRALIELSQSQVTELRSFVRSMRPVEPGANIVADIVRLADSFEKESGIPVTFVGEDRRISVAPEISRDVLQMIREALHNVQKHARASRVGMALESSGRQMDISIDDNGVGFPFSGSYTLDELELLRLGPVSLKRRARTIHAQLLLESRPGRGAGIRIRVPL
jgi:signal transduction histidine kinase